MIATLLNQVEAAGGKSINGSIITKGDITLLVNNFETYPQKQAYDIPWNGPYDPNDYGVFDYFICDNQKTSILGFADNRYSNGADVQFVRYIMSKTSSCQRNISTWAYAGWNTDGNTLGTVIANSIIVYLFKN